MSGCPTRLALYGPHSCDTNILEEGMYWAAKATAQLSHHRTMESSFAPYVPQCCL